MGHPGSVATSGAQNGQEAVNPTGSVAEPIYVRQSGDVMTEEEARHWFHGVAQEAYEEGVKHARFSVHPDIPNLRIFEGWAERPPCDGEGEIRWALTATAEPADARAEGPAPSPDAELGPGRNK